MCLILFYPDFMFSLFYLSGMTKFPKLFIHVRNLSSSLMNSSEGSCHVLFSHNFGMSKFKASDTCPLAIKSSISSSLTPGSFGKELNKGQFLTQAGH